MPKPPMPSDSVLDKPVSTVDGVGPARVTEFKKLEVETVGDLLAYFPRDYQMEAGERPIGELVPGQIQSARGEVVAVDYIAGRPARFEATLDDGTGKLALAWFNSAFLRGQIHPGDQLVVQGMVKLFRNLPQMAQSKWSKVEDGEVPAEQGGEPAVLRPVYPASQKLNSEAIAGLIEENLSAWLPHVHEWFADDLLRGHGLIGRREAYRLIHQPGDWARAKAARRRLVYDELMVLQLGLGIGKRLRQGRLTAAVLRLDKTLDARIRKRFPFELTEAQTQAIWQIVRDLQSGVPMNRLLQGDVGSGKTVVAVYAMLMAVANKMQAVLLAPTEVLAEQHYLTLTNLMKDSGVKVELYTGRTRRTTRGTIMTALADGRVHLAVGTQALLQEGVKFANLGLVVVDEQHKLGVQQRLRADRQVDAPVGEGRGAVRMLDEDRLELLLGLNQALGVQIAVRILLGGVAGRDDGGLRFLLGSNGLRRRDGLGHLLQGFGQLRIVVVGEILANISGGGRILVRPTPATGAALPQPADRADAPPASCAPRRASWGL